MIFSSWWARLLLLIGIALIGAEIVFLSTFTLKEVAVADVMWEKDPGFLTIFNQRRDGENGILFIRLKDGKEQFVIGTWKVNFSSSGAYAYGKFPDKEGLKMYYLSGDDRIYDIDITQVDGTIASVQENPSGSYMVLEVEKDNRTIYCVTPKVTGEAIACQQLGVGAVSASRWNPAKERELVIQTAAQEIFTYDPWEKQPNLIDQTDPIYHELTGIFKVTTDMKSIAAGNNTVRFWQIFNMVIVQDGKGLTTYRIPWGATVSWFADEKHMLVKESNRLSILELPTRSMATIFTSQNVGESTIQYYLRGFDVVLKGRNVAGN